LSDDGRHGLTLIAFVGSVFSPYYAWARRRGEAPALNHCSINVALYGPLGRWLRAVAEAHTRPRPADSGSARRPQLLPR
jgi:carotenoid 1,2-hydratase